MRASLSAARGLALLPLLWLGCDRQPTEAASSLDSPTSSGAALDVSARGASLYQFNGAGEFADASWRGSDPSGFTSGFLTVNRASSRSGGPATTTTFLMFSFYQCDGMFLSCMETAGWGTIPNEDFSGTRLHTNTATNPRFFSYVCRWSERGGSCEEGGGTGSIAVEWAVDRFTGVNGHGTWRAFSPNFSSISTGSFSSRVATPTGQVNTWSLAGGAMGNVGTSHGTQINIYRN